MLFLAYGKMKRILLIVLIIIFTSACSAQQTQSAPTSATTTILEPASTQPSGNPPLTEADVPRVTVEEAKAALDSGAAVVVDVRDPTQYEQSHVAGAISIGLDDIEANPTGVDLDKDQWIITYCT
jgi:3-mercaptopyruvate sulfurtransferase SseA